MRRRALALLGVLVSALWPPASPVWAALSVGANAQSGLRFWQWEEAGVSIRLVQRLPDQTRAFFEARGFAPATTDALARSCVFQVIFRNAAQAPAAVEHDLGEWRVVTGTGERGLAIAETWEQEWERVGVAPAARIAFRWALLPTRQRYEPGDYHWGMVAFGPEPGASFDLLAVWRRGGRTERARIEGVECAPDVQP